ncbi:hypothetical protein I5J49_gp34 [Mycobacterium phage ThulaThula]|uniref:Uncharacterized protein n=1 Tax=Mycobacterium phage ThulaThula TaxID=2599880 RepID=A0A5J6TGW0_9CAUD|nr:hypothetical protein I5J49_gp34 [Mycobacterium phage ThulaThula]QFG09107.1 hypothetical protein PBI_THULATHULA_34 [Mycobacterium phage ThulaThula]
MAQFGTIPAPKRRTGPLERGPDLGGRCRIRTCVGVSRRIYSPWNSVRACPAAFASAAVNCVNGSGVFGLVRPSSARVVTTLAQPARRLGAHGRERYSTISGWH